MSATPGRRGSSKQIVPLLNHVAERTHQRDALRLGESFLLETLHEFEGVEVVVPLHTWGRMEAAGLVEG